jgi:hypothetical protein
MEQEETTRLEITDEEIVDTFRLLTSRPVTHRTISVGKCIAKIAQWNIIEALKLGLLPLRVGNYYLIKADLLDEIFEKLDKNSIEQANNERGDKKNH